MNEEIHIPLSPIEPKPGKLTSALVVTACASMIGGSVSHGWNSGVLNTPANLVKQFLNDSMSAHYGAPSTSSLNIMWSAAVALYLVGGCAGAFSAGIISNTFGRKRGLLFCYIFIYIAALLSSFCELANSLEMLFIGRTIAGFGCGACGGLVPMYLTEIAPVNYRGAMGVIHQLGITVGILLTQIFGISQLLGQDNLWPILLGFPLVFCTISLVTLLFYPESPKFLLINKGKQELATKSLQRFRNEADVSAIIKEFIVESERAKLEPKWTMGKLLKSKALRLPLILVCALNLGQQLSGINAVFYYSTAIFQSAGIEEDNIQYANIGTGVVNVIMTLLAVPLMEKCGRRILLLGGMVVMVIFEVVLVLTLSFDASWLSYVSIAATIILIIGFAVGYGPIPMFVGAELFKTGPRPPAMSLAGLFNWAGNFLVALLFPIIESNIHQYVYCIFIAFTILFVILFWLKLPETKNKSYDEIYRGFGIEDTELVADQSSSSTESNNSSTRRKKKKVPTATLR